MWWEVKKKVETSGLLIKIFEWKCLFAHTLCGRSVLFAPSVCDCGRNGLFAHSPGYLLSCNYMILCKAVTAAAAHLVPQGWMQKYTWTTSGFLNQYLTGRGYMTRGYIFRVRKIAFTCFLRILRNFLHLENGTSGAGTEKMKTLFYRNVPPKLTFQYSESTFDHLKVVFRPFQVVPM